MNPWQLLFQSRKFWLLLLDTVISLIATILGAILTPDKLAFVLGIVAIIQPVFVAIIMAIAKEDAATKAINGTIIKRNG